MAIRDIQAEADYGRVKVDRELSKLERQITKVYRRASIEVRRDLDRFLASYEERDKRMQEQVKKGTLSEEDYKEWRERQIFRSDAMKAKVEDLTKTMVNADKVAMAMVNEKAPQIYATSYNFGIFRGEVSADLAGFDYTPFTIYNADAVRILATEDPDLIPWKPSVDTQKDTAWNRKHIQNAIQQGILQGDDMRKISKRLLPAVGMDKNAAIRTARTATNGIENKARHDSCDKLIKAGIPMERTWSSTHDGRTRYSHVLLDGTHPNDDGVYENGLHYPAEPNGDVSGSEIYNCRCCELSTLAGIDHSHDDELYAQFMESNYYEDWVGNKEKGVKGVKDYWQGKEREFRGRQIEAQAWKQRQNEKIAKAEENNKKEFSNKNSKIKQVLYHGSSRDFEKFQTKHIGENTGNKGLFGEGLYFTQKMDLAETYAEGGYVYSVKVNVENPFNWNNIKTEEQFNEFKKEIGVDALEWNRYEKQIKVILDEDVETEFTKALKKAGYDGVIYKYKSGAKEFVVFDDDQIKIIEKKRIKKEA